MIHTMPRVTRMAASIGLFMVGSMPANAVPAEEPAATRLRAAIAHYWDDQLRKHPIEATIFVGDHRRAGDLDDPSLEAFTAWLDRLRATRSELTAIDPALLTPGERIDREILLKTIDGRLESVPFGEHFAMRPTSISTTSTCCLHSSGSFSRRPPAVISINSCDGSSHFRCLRISSSL
jgi:uncharacterized protein (DUF885 family)